ncbi:MAG: nickel-dependent lactate racemase [Candidatus Lokiarchaeota archaeon]|nr:nickel-dependent lactate racemase [Candidatus Lokiarchaeota archaeon]
MIGIDQIKFPEMIQIEQNVPDIHLTHIFETVQKQIAKTKFNKKIKEGSKVAIAVGSRNINKLADVILALITEVKKIGGIPFIVPAMGSHGGGTADGQVEMLRDMGINSKKLDIPIISSMEVIKIGETKSHIPLYIDKNAMLADAIIIVARIKPHTDFSGEIESGLLKMLAVGLGKHKGATIMHNYGIESFSKIIPEVGLEALEKAPIALGIALLENNYSKLSEIVAIDPENFFVVEKKLLRKEKQLMPVLPLSEIDILLVNEIGKDISGAGMDPNVIGRSKSAEKNMGKNIHIIIPLDLTEKTRGNAAGIGLSDLITKKIFEKIDFNVFYTNLLTSNGYLEGKIPLVLKDDEYAIKVAMKILNKNHENVRMVRIQNTLNIIRMEISKALLGEVKNNKKINIVGEARRLKVDKEGNLLTYPY